MVRKMISHRRAALAEVTRQRDCSPARLAKPGHEDQLVLAILEASSKQRERRAEQLRLASLLEVTLQRWDERDAELARGRP